MVNHNIKKGSKSNQQDNANENHNEIYHLIPVRMAIIKKTKNNKRPLVQYWWACKLA